MKKCEWCDRELDDEFIQTHHINHIHEDDRPENRVEICIKCHQRHHRECGNTILVPRSEYKPKTLEEEIAEIDRKYFLKCYELNYGNKHAKEKLIALYGPPPDPDFSIWWENAEFRKPEDRPRLMPQSEPKSWPGFSTMMESNRRK